jgi:hypothetical protein
MEFDDQNEPLLQYPETERLREPPPPPPAPPPTDSRLYIAIGAVALLLGAAGAWWFANRSAPPPSNATPVAATEGVVPGEPSRPLPPLDQMDTFLRALIGALSSNPTLARWLATDDLIRQMADSIDTISRGQSPTGNLGVLKPQDVISVRGPRGQLTIDPKSYRRYDSLTAAVMSLNPKGVAEAYRTIQPRLDEAYRALGRSENNVDEAVAVALDLLIATPEVRDPIRVVPGKGATYAYADPKIEALAPIQKLLIRTGPANAAAINERLREIRAALALPPNQR